MEPNEGRAWQRRKAVVAKLNQIDPRKLKESQVEAGIQLAREFRDSNRKLLKAVKTRRANN
ncbi:MAG: hypothetical protein JST93_30375 [Acidobacteria bacterium]|nr:hypothetical protein [Acidobacteriota bacterium]